jgi:B3 DNA binding domain
MDVFAGPLLDFCNHAADTVQLGNKNTDLEMEAIFLTFLDDRVNDTCQMNVNADVYLRAHRKPKKCSTSASMLSKKKIDNAPLLASSQSSMTTTLRTNKPNDMCRFDRHECTLKRCITNDTYLRRLYMPADQVTTLFPFLFSKLLAMTEIRFKNCQRFHSQLSTLYHDFIMADANGRRWTVTCDCKMSSSGTLHCRLTRGWSQFCRDNNVAIHDDVVLVRGCGQSVDVNVYVDRRDVSNVT